jgi:putative Mg2+ transporter-C (MgtC) family protein
MNIHDLLTTLTRLGIAIFVGGLIGLNRQLEGKPAGIRTHMMVSLGAALMVMIPQQAFPGIKVDALSRTIQGIATGIGFLGAGEILHRPSPSGRGQSVKGLTSAAALWATAALGMASGVGLWVTSLTATALILLILTVVQSLEKYLPSRSNRDS